MTLISHTITAYLLAILFNLNPIFAVIGSIFPDLIEIPFKMKHRKESHELLFSCFITTMSFFILPEIIKNFLILNNIQAFTLGYLSHILLDSLTISGVYFFPLKKRISLMPHFKIRTGTFSEFIFISFFSVFLGILIFIKPFLIYYLNYYELYNQGIIDKKEFIQGIFNR